MRKTRVLGKRKKFILVLEYLTNISVKMEIDRTSTNLETEYKIGTNNFLLLINGDEINLVRESTSLQHKFKPCPPTG